MKITELKANTVYALTYNDNTKAGSAYGSASLYATTGPEVELIQGRPGRHSYDRATPTRVRLFPIPGAPERFPRPKDGEPITSGEVNELGTIRQPELRRGLSIVAEVCPTDEWMAYRTQRLAEQAKRQAEADEARQARKAMENRMVDALRALDIDPDDLTGGYLMSVARCANTIKNAAKVLAIMEAAGFAALEDRKA
jgi:hypothetical protein